MESLYGYYEWPIKLLYVITISGFVCLLIYAIYTGGGYGWILYAAFGSAFFGWLLFLYSKKSREYYSTRRIYSRKAN